jgi:hypothetical protein
MGYTITLEKELGVYGEDGLMNDDYHILNTSGRLFKPYTLSKCYISHENL